MNGLLPGLLNGQSVAFTVALSKSLPKISKASSTASDPPTPWPAWIKAVTNGLASAPGTHRSAQAVEEILSALARALPTRMGASSAAFVREQQVLSRLSREFGLTEDALHTRLTARRREIASRGRSQRAAKPASDEPRSTQRLTLSAWERELLELLLHQPEVLPRLAEVLKPEEIPTNVCRAFYAQALAAMHAGQIPTFDQLMLSTDDNDAKNLLVDCDERGRDKLASDTDQRVRDLIDQVHENSLHERQSKQLAVFHTKTLEPKKEDEEIDKFYKELAKKQTKRRQTGSAPTDG